MTSLSIIVPTAGRVTIERTILSYLPQMAPCDELLVMGDTTDGPLPKTATICDQYGPLVRYVPCSSRAHSWGHNEINRGLELAHGDYVLGNDDDDIAAPGALGIIRDTVAGLDAPRPLLFRFRSYVGQVFWDREGNFQENHVGGHCGVFANLPGRVGRYTERYQGDFDYLKSTIDLWPNGIEDALWVDKIIAIARPAL